MKDWLNKGIPAIADTIEKQILASYHIETEEGLNVAGRDAIYSILDDILSVLFPGAYSKENIYNGGLNFYLNDVLRHICHKLSLHIEDVLNLYCSKGNCDICSCKNNAKELSMEFIKSIPTIRATLMKDIESGFKGDPASKSYQEVILSYPYIEAVATHRIAHKLYTLEVPIIPRIMAERAHSHTGIDIHPGATIDEGFFIDHGTGVVIGETCNIGKNVTIYHGVTLGAFSPFDREGNQYKGKKRHPDVEDNAIIYSGAVILGGKTVIGAGSVIGGNAWITKSVAPNSVVYNRFDTVVKGQE